MHAMYRHNMRRPPSHVKEQLGKGTYKSMCIFYAKQRQIISNGNTYQLAKSTDTERKKNVYTYGLIKLQYFNNSTFEI